MIILFGSGNGNDDDDSDGGDYDDGSNEQHIIRSKIAFRI